MQTDGVVAMLGEMSGARRVVLQYTGVYLGKATIDRE